MLEELRRHPEFMPSGFWEDIAGKNLRMLEAQGLENFKRTVANNYFNWLLFSLEDPQFRNVYRQWLRHPRLRTLLFRVSSDRSVQTMLQEKPESLSIAKAWMYGFFVSTLWDLGLRLDRRGILAALDEPTLGNPIRVMRGDRIIAQDPVNSSLELGAILGLPRVRDGALERLGMVFRAVCFRRSAFFGFAPSATGPKLPRRLRSVTWPSSRPISWPWCPTDISTWSPRSAHCPR